MVEIYRARSGNGVVPVAQRRSTSIASALGRGLGQVGAAAGEIAETRQRADDAIADSEFRIAEDQKRRDDHTFVGSIATETTEADLLFEARREELRQSIPAGEQYVEAVTELLGEVYGPIDSKVQERNDPEMAARLGPMLTSRTAAHLQRERDWSSATAAKRDGENYAKLGIRDGDILQSDPDAFDLDERYEAHAAMIDAIPTGADFKAALKRIALETLVTGKVNGLIQNERFDEAQALVSDEAFAGFFGGRKADLLKGIGTGRAVQAREAERQANAAQRATLDRLRSMEVDLENGEVPPMSDISAAIAAAQAAGVDEATLKEFGYLTERVGAATGARTRGDEEIERELSEIVARRRAGDGSREDDVRQKALEAELKRRRTEAAPEIRALAKSDPVAAAGQLAPMPVAQRWDAAREAGEERLAVYATLTPQGRVFAADGRAARQARPDDFLPPKDSRGQGGGESGAREIFSAILGRSIQAQLGGTYTAHLEAALDLMAGASGNDRWDEAGFRRSVQMVMGSTHRGGGVWQGGIGTLKYGQRVELPSDYTAAEFDADFQRRSFPGAVYANGQAADPADVKRHFTLRYAGQSDRGNALYLLIGPDSKPLLRADNRQAYYLPFTPRRGAR